MSFFLYRWNLAENCEQTESDNWRNHDDLLFVDKIEKLMDETRQGVEKQSDWRDIVERTIQNKKMRTKLNCRTRQECTRGYNIDQMCQKNYQKKKKEKRCKIARGAQTALLGQISINKFSFIPLALCATIDRKCRNSGCVARSLNLGHSRARSRSRGNFRF